MLTFSMSFWYFVYNFQIRIAVFSFISDNIHAYLSSSVALPLQLDTDEKIHGITTIGNKFYLLRTERNAMGSVQNERHLLGTGLIQLQLQESFYLNGSYVYRKSYTQCASVLFHLQLWYSKVTTKRTLQLEFSDLHLVETDTCLSHLTNTVSFDLDQTYIGQPSNINQMLILRSPEKLYAHGLCGTMLNIRGTCNDMSLTVMASHVSSGFEHFLFKQNDSYSNDITFHSHTCLNSPLSV